MSQPSRSPTEPGQSRRLDPRMLLIRVLTLAALRDRVGLIAPVLALVGLRGGVSAAGVAAAVLVVLGFTTLAALVHWLRFRYTLGDGRLVVEQGLLRRSLTVVPLDRVRGVDVHASALQRLLGIASVRVDAAATGGSGDEAVLDAVSRAEAERLRQILLRWVEPAGASVVRTAANPAVAANSTASSTAALPRAHPAGAGASGATGPGAAAAGAAGYPGAGLPAGRQVGAGAAVAAGGGLGGEPIGADQVLARLSVRWLFYGPLVGGYLLAPVAALAALQQYLDELGVSWLDRLGRQLGEQRPTPLLLAGAAAAVVVLCAAGAVATAAVANWGFTLSRRGGALVSERGLLSRRQVTLELARIRGYALLEPLLLRLAGAARLVALVTGLGGEGTRRGQLLPLGPARVARRVAATAVLPFEAGLRRHPPAALRRRLVRASLPGLLLGGMFAVVGNWSAAGAAAVLAALGLLLGVDRYRGLGHALTEHAVCVRSGSLRRRQVVLQRAGVVGWRVRQSFFQRRAGLATLTVATGAGSGGYDVIDVAAAAAVELMHEVTPRQVHPLLRGTG